MKNRYDVIIAGSGAIGSSCAYRLAKSGLSVLVVDRKDACMGTGGATGGLLSWFTKKPGYHLDLFVESSKMFAPLEEEIGPFGLHEEGSLQVIENDFEMEMAKKSLERDDIPDGFSLEILQGKALLEVEPFIDPELPGALWIPQSGRVEVFEYIYALIAASKRLGAEFLNETRVTGLLREGDRILGIRTDRGDFYGDTVVNACGVWGAELPAMLGIDLPIKPRRGQMVAMEQRSRFVFHLITSSMYQTIKFHPELITDEVIHRIGYSFGIEQTDAGTTILSGTREFAGFDPGVTLEGASLMIRGASRVFPCLKDMHFIRTFSGLRPYTPDGLPFIGPLGGLKGFLMACGHEGDGIALSPITGELICQLIRNGGTARDISPLRWDRFRDA